MVFLLPNRGRAILKHSFTPDEFFTCIFTSPIGHVDPVYEITRHHPRLIKYLLNPLQSFQHPASVTCLSFNYLNPTSSIQPFTFPCRFCRYSHHQQRPIRPES
ncbi:hypothetical protein J3E69DRAFT_346441 [Trichoderma sp. SZMC 28015]